MTDDVITYLFTFAMYNYRNMLRIIKKKEILVKPVLIKNKSIFHLYADLAEIIVTFRCSFFCE